MRDRIISSKFPEIELTVDQVMAASFPSAAPLRKYVAAHLGADV
jgi:hypothetical protein